MTTAPADPASKVEPGTVLASRYRLAEKLGEGGMGIVYAADHLELKTRVAIKLLQPSLVEDPTARARFLREARLAASIEGEHSTRIHDVGIDSSGHPYIVMERLIGETASVRLARERRLSALDATTVIVQVLAVLAEAHSKGLVHRDLKPANLFLVDRPGEAVWVKVLDFGISKQAETEGTSNGRANTTLTGPRVMLGSPEYMSPEQLRDSASVDARSDLWACGVILFELLSGTTPFASTSLPDLYGQIVSQEPRLLSGADMVPAAVSRMIARCLQKDPGRRPQSAYEIAVGLAPFASDSARALLPRMRAWCKSELPLPGEPPSSRRVMLGGVSLVAVAGMLAFAAASIKTPLVPVAATSSSVREIGTLDPLLPISPPIGALPSVSADASSTEGRASIPPPPQPSSSASPRSQARPRRSSDPLPARPSHPSRRDLDGIDLLQ